MATYNFTNPFTGNTSSIKAVGHTSKKQAREAVFNAQVNSDLAKGQMDYMNQFNEQMYLKYNSPEAMMRQYEEAGLNPYAALSGNVSNGGMSESASADSSAMQYDPMTNQGLQNVLGMFQGLVGIAQQMQQLKSTSLQNQALQIQNKLAPFGGNSNVVDALLYKYGVYDGRFVRGSINGQEPKTVSEMIQDLFFESLSNRGVTYDKERWDKALSELDTWIKSYSANRAKNGENPNISAMDEWDMDFYQDLGEMLNQFMQSFGFGKSKSFYGKLLHKLFNRR